MEVCSKVVMFRKNLDKPVPAHYIGRSVNIQAGDSNPIPSSPAFPLYALVRALSDAARSRTSSSSHLRDTQRDGRNQGDVSGRELEGELLASHAHERPLRSTIQVKSQRTNTKI